MLFRYALTAVCLAAALLLYTDAVYWFGYSHGQAARSCAVVPGEQAVSTTHDTCTYATSYGRATRKRRAI